MSFPRSFKRDNHMMEEEQKIKNQAEQSDFDRRLLDKMKADGLSPKPRWRFLLQNYVIWISGALALLIGAAATTDRLRPLLSSLNSLT